MTNIVFKSHTPDKIFTGKDAIDEKEVYLYLSDFLKNFKEFTEDDLRSLNNYWKIRKVKKGEFLFTEGQEIKELSFIVHGSVKLYKEFERCHQILALLTEANFCTMKKTFCLNTFAEYHAQAIEGTVLLTIDHENMSQLLKDFPVFYNFFSEQNENIILFLQNRLTALQVLTAQERYEELLQQQPDLIARFTLTDIANFLGMTGETLSRVRSVISKKDLKIAI